MKKKILLSFMLICVSVFALGVLSVSAYTGTQYGDTPLYYEVSNGEVTITDCDETAKTIEIPSTIDGKPVTSIGNNAFRSCISLTSITIPLGVKRIRDCAFEGCSGLTSITIPDGVTSIDDDAFRGCSSLTSIKIPNSVTSIGEWVFSNCSSLTSITIPKSVTSIGHSVFRFCSSLASITIPNSVTSIGNYAFYGCSGLTNITIPDSVTSIGTDAFWDCRSLISITIPDSVTSIGGSAFSGCNKLESVYITDLAAYLNCEYGGYDSNPMYYAKKLYINGKRATKVIVPSTVRKIPDYAFNNCDSLTSITVPDSVTSIGNHAFDGCKNLTSITIPDGVTSIGDSTFSGCSSLTSITIPDSVTSIGEYAFSGCSGLTSITIPDSVTSIGNHAFSGCSGLTSITIPDGVTNIGNSIFSYCYNLTHITIPNSITNIGDYMFSECRKLTNIVIPDSVTSIGGGAFYNCYSLTSITIPDSVTSIGGIAFYYCYALTEITLPQSVTEIEQGAFNYCSKLSTVYYNGDEQLWEEIYIGANNDYLKNAERKYFWYVTLIDENGEVISKKQYDPNTLIDLSDVEQKFEHTIHLYTDEDCENEFELTTPITGNLTLQLRYIVNQYNAKFIDDDGTLISEGLVDYGAVIIPPADPTKARTQKYTYTFAGWENFIPGETTQTNSEMVFKATYTATINQYTYKFIDSDETIIKEETVDYGTVITLPEPPADKDPYTFDYWENYSDGMILTDNIEFNAVYKYKTYTITVKGLENQIDVVYGDAFEIETQTPETEYLFAGYYTEENGKGTKVTDESGKSLENYGFLENITLYPYFPHELLNKIKINGESSTVVGNTDVVKKVYFATDKEASYLLCNIKYPETISLKEIVPIDFKYVSEESRKTIDGTVYINIIAQYTNDLDNLPINKKLEPFELIFDIPKDTKPQNAAIEVTGESMVIGDNDYPFDLIINGELEIAAKSVEVISIIGDDTVVLENGDAAYTAEITPDYATNKEVAWSVDNEEVSEISQNGILTPLKSGKATITASAKDGSGVFATKEVTILPFARIISLTANIGQWDKEFNADTREYTIYVPYETDEVSFTANYIGGVLKIDNGTTTATMIKNRAKSVKLDENGANVVLLMQNQKGCADSEYKINIVKLEGTRTVIEEDGKTFNILPVNMAVGKTIILVLYDNGKTVEIKSEKYNGTAVSFTTEKAYTNAKVMVFESLSDIKPVCGVETVK